MEPHVRPKAKKNQKKIGILVIGGILLAGLGFLGGIQYQKGQTSQSGTQTAGAPNVSDPNTLRGRFGARMGGFGTVSAVSSTSITISNQRTGTDQTYAISSTTTVTDNGTTSTVSAIKVGDTVVVRPDTSDTSKASQIILNPQLPTGGFGGGQQGPTTDPQSGAN